MTKYTTARSYDMIWKMHANVRNGMINATDKWT